MFDPVPFRGRLALVGLPAFVALPSTLDGWNWVVHVADERQYGLQTTESVIQLAAEGDVDLERARVGRSRAYALNPWPRMQVRSWYVEGGPERVYAELPDWIDKRPFAALMEMMEGGGTLWGGLLSDLRELGVLGRLP